MITRKEETIYITLKIIREILVNDRFGIVYYSKKLKKFVADVKSILNIWNVNKPSEQSQ